MSSSLNVSRFDLARFCTLVPILLTPFSSCLVAMKQTLFSGFIQMAAGLSVGLSCLAGKLE